MGHRPIVLTLLFFVLRGITVPSLDWIHYYFVLGECKIEQGAYDLLTVNLYLGLFIGSMFM